MIKDNSGTASFDQKLIDMVNDIIDDISTILLKDGKGIVVLKDEEESFQWFIESLSLMAKQVNLCESCMLLLENGMEQEAFILARSQYNNMLWIKYLMNDTKEHTHYKEFYYQPYINQIFKDKKLLELINKYGDDLDDRFKSNDCKELLENRISANQKFLSENGADLRTKSIADLARQDPNMFASYVTLYNDSSKFEHSDISVTQNYRKNILKEYDINTVFKFELGLSDEDMWFRVFHYSLSSLFWAYQAIEDKIMSEDAILLNIDTKSKSATYNKNDLVSILAKIAACQEQYNKDVSKLRSETKTES